MKIVLQGNREGLQAAARLRLQWLEGLTPAALSEEIERLKGIIEHLSHDAG